MKVLTTISSLALLSSSALATLSNVNLFVSSDDQTINGSGVSAPHEGAGIGYLFVGNDGGYFATANTVPFIYDSDEQQLNWWSTPTIKQGFSTFTNTQNGITVVELIVGDYSSVTFENGFLAYEGSTSGFYALGNISDPYDYSNVALAIVRDVNASPEGGIPISLTAVFESGSATQPAPVESTILTTAPTYTILPSTTITPSTTISITVATETSSTSASSTSATESSTTVAVVSSDDAAGSVVPGTFLGAAALVAGLLM
ncbi:hypothetical protein DFJ63DRAFT_334962 [Scheffersomyces coipomensis]|uniref:uncharacterized protein n=1 Tax=Scheffersomyces coipomensis TaxID=1788519 RepID=UPI00315CAD87